MNCKCNKNCVLQYIYVIKLVENGSTCWLLREYTCKETCGIQKDSAVDKGVLCVEKTTDTTLQ